MKINKQKSPLRTYSAYNLVVLTDKGLHKLIIILREINIKNNLRQIEIINNEVVRWCDLFGGKYRPS